MTIPNTVVDRMFVYGTLRQGQTARRLIESYVRTSEPAACRGTMYAFASGYPGVILDGSTPIVGELVQLDDLPAALPLLDAYEGADFTRILAEVEGPGGLCWAWIYVLSDPGLARQGTLVPEGDWSLQAPK